MSGVFKAIGKAFKAIVKSPIFKVILVAAAIYFTAGMAAAAFPAAAVATEVSAGAMAGVGFGASAEVLALGSVGIDAAAGLGTFGTMASIAGEVSSTGLGLLAGETEAGLAAAESGAGLLGEASAGAGVGGEALSSANLAENLTGPLVNDTSGGSVMKVSADVPATEVSGSTTGAGPEGWQPDTGATTSVSSTNAGLSAGTQSSNLWGQIKDLGSDALKWFDNKSPAVQKMLSQGGIEAIKMGFQAYQAGAAADAKAQAELERRTRIGTPADLSNTYTKPYTTPGIINAALNIPKKVA